MSGNFIKAGVIYFLIGTVWGWVMSAAQAFEYTSAHAHINLVGWASLGLIGVIYKAFPELGEAKLARIQFWLHIIGLPLLIASMVIFTTVHHDVGIPFAAVGALLITASAVVMVINVFKRIG